MAKVINVQEANRFGNNDLDKTSYNATKTSSNDPSKAFEEILKFVGDRNAFQWKLMCVCGLLGIFTGWHNIGAVYLAATPKHQCEIPYLVELNQTQYEELYPFAVPKDYNKLKKLEPSTCRYYDFDISGNENPASFLNNETKHNDVNIIKCEDWRYDRSVYKSTIVSEWGLVCDKRALMSTAQASYMLGILFGAVICSALSDKFGRRRVSLTCSAIFIISTISVAFSNVLTTFLVLRFIVAFTGHGAYLANYVLCMENVGEKGRSIMGSVFHSFFSFGFISLNLFAYLLRNWRHLQLGLSIPTIMLIGHYWLLPESPRWLLMQGREKEALDILKKMADVNDKEFPHEEKLRPYLDVIAQVVRSRPVLSTKQKFIATITSLADLVKTKIMRRRSLILFYIWFVVSMLYYGLTFAGATIDASVYLSVTISSLGEIPSTILLIILVQITGRRVVTCSGFLLGGILIVCVAFTPTALVGLNVALATLGKICMSICFGMVYILCAELYPTSVRNVALGTSSMFARIGSSIAPYIVDLLGNIYYATPFIIFGVLAIVAGLLCILLPETKNKKLPESVSEIESKTR